MKGRFRMMLVSLQDFVLRVYGRQASELFGRLIVSRYSQALRKAKAAATAKLREARDTRPSRSINATIFAEPMPEPVPGDPVPAQHVPQLEIIFGPSYKAFPATRIS